MKNVKTTFSQIVMVCIVGLTIACWPQPPVRVLVTPTPGATDTSSSATVEMTADQVAAQAATVSPTFLGAVVGPSYTPPSPPPTATTAPPATAMPTATPTGPTATPIPQLDAARIGVQIDANLTNDAWFYVMDRVSQLGVGWIKIQFNWNFYQPNGPDEWSEDMRRIELYLFEANRRGMNVIISVAKAPNWSRANPVGDGPPDDPAMLANFFTFLFSGGPQEFNLMEQVDAIEIWNEPNLAREWGGQPLNGQSYMRYFTAAYDAIRAAAPTMPIISAGLAPTGDSQGSRDDRGYLQEMYDAGLGAYSDVYVGTHPFSWGNPPDAVCCDAVEGQGWDDDPHFFFSHNVNEYRDLMNRNGHGAVQMWVTEFGWASWEGFSGALPQEWMAYNDNWEQGHYAIRALELGLGRGDIRVMVLWNLNFANALNVQNSDEIAAYAIMPDVTGIRPLFWMLHDAVRPPEQRLNRYDLPG
ncbi:MAG: cellulase family glycosylhydrolase [Chloroflexi bacterium]|nr:cellulase family glycosylhydrolase [Chloroflexota bacterium]